MFGFKRFRNAPVTISGIELMHRIGKCSPITTVHLKVTTAPEEGGFPPPAELHHKPGRYLGKNRGFPGKPPHVDYAQPP